MDHPIDHAGAAPLLRRRDFLTLGSVLVLSQCLPGVAWAEDILASPSDDPMAVGYLEGSRALPSLKHLPRGIRRPAMAAEEGEEAASYRVVPAPRLPLGDTSLIGRPLRMRIQGLYPPAALNPKRQREMPFQVDLDVLVPSEDPLIPGPFAFHAWSFKRWQGWNPSPPVSFRFPLDWRSLPELVMTVHPADGGAPYRTRAQFTFDDEKGRSKLHRGLYLLGLSQKAWDAEPTLADLGGKASARAFSILMSMEPEVEE